MKIAIRLIAFIIAYLNFSSPSSVVIDSDGHIDGHIDGVVNQARETIQGKQK